MKPFSFAAPLLAIASITSPQMSFADADPVTRQVVAQAVLIDQETTLDLFRCKEALKPTDDLGSYSCRVELSKSEGVEKIVVADTKEYKDKDKECTVTATADATGYSVEVSTSAKIDVNLGIHFSFRPRSHTDAKVRALKCVAKAFQEGGLSEKPLRTRFFVTEKEKEQEKEKKEEAGQGQEPGKEQ